MQKKQINDAENKIKQKHKADLTPDAKAKMMLLKIN
jgi:hypothetical protein